MEIQGVSKIAVENSSAPLIWAQFYDIDINKPVFSSCDVITRNSSY